MRKIIISSIILIVLLAFAFKKENPDKKALDATFALYADSKTGPQFACTATIFKSSMTGGYYLLTAGHCIIPNTQYSVSEQIGSSRMPVRVVKFENDNFIDMAVLDFETTKRYPIIPLGDDVEIGAKAESPNFALGIAKQLSFGSVSSNSLGNVDSCDFCSGKQLVQIDGSHGSSGAAVIVDDKIVAVIIAEVEGINVGLVAEPISSFSAFLDSPKK